MNKTLAVWALSFAAFGAAAAVPSDESIERLLVLSKSEALLDSMYANMEQSMRMGMAQAAAGKPISEEQRRLLDSTPKKLAEVMRQELNWAKLKPLFVQIYKESLDQDDVDGLNDFYASKAGQAMINKMPVVMQRATAAIQQIMAPLVGKMTVAMKAAVEEAKLDK